MKKADVEKLAARAIKARGKAYAPYSHHPVGAALMTDTGKIFAGANCEIANYDATCAENSAIAAMVTAGERRIAAIAVAGPPREDGLLCTPCGRCRQRLREFSDAKTRVYSLRPDGAIGAIHTIDALLPQSFGPGHLEKLK